jgi:hypothetical protein
MHLGHYVMRVTLSDINKFEMDVHCHVKLSSIILLKSIQRCSRSSMSRDGLQTSVLIGTSQGHESAVKTSYVYLR